MNFIDQLRNCHSERSEESTVGHTQILRCAMTDKVKNDSLSQPRVSNNLRMKGVRGGIRGVLLKTNWERHRAGSDLHLPH